MERAREVVQSTIYDTMRTKENNLNKIITLKAINEEIDMQIEDLERILETLA